MKRIHATAVAIRGKGILLRGRSGTGKSDLALRLIDGGAKLIADDVVEVEKRGTRLEARAPTRLRGKMEVRGVGIVAVPTVRRASVVLVVDLVAADAVVRYPEPAHAHILGIRVKLLKLWAFEASAPAKLRLAVRGREADSTAPR